MKGAPILGTRSSQLVESSSPSRLNNQSQTRSNGNVGETAHGKQKTKKAKSTDGKQKKKTKKTIKEQENTWNTPNTSSTGVIDLCDSFSDDINSVNKKSSTANFIDLDALTDSQCDDTNETIEILNQSNNSNSQGTAGRSAKRYITRQTPMHTCEVFNCGAVFSSEGALKHHENLFKHSPCNPCLKIVDCKVSPDTHCFMCPKCDKEFQVMFFMILLLKPILNCYHYAPASIDTVFGLSFCLQKLLHSFLMVSDSTFIFTYIFLGVKPFL